MKSIGVIILFILSQSACDRVSEEFIPIPNTIEFKNDSCDTSATLGRLRFNPKYIDQKTRACKIPSAEFGSIFEKNTRF